MESFLSVLFYGLPFILLAVFLGLSLKIVYDRWRRSSALAKVEKLQPGEKVLTIKDLEAVVVGVNADTIDLEIKGHCASYDKRAVKKIIR